MKLLCVVFTILFSGTLFAQRGDIPAPVLNDLAKDLAELQSSVAEAQRQLQGAQTIHSIHSAMIGSGVVTVTNPLAFARAGAADTADSLFRPGKGQKYTIIDKSDNWYAVRFPESIKGYSSGWIKAADVVPLIQASTSTQQAAQSMRQLNEDIYRNLTERVAQLRRAYQDNQYVFVSGFSVNVGVPPSVTVAFEFKK